MVSNLGQCADKISVWNKKTFGSVQSKLIKHRKNIEALKEKERTPSNVKEEKNLTDELDEWRLREELLWKQRSRVDWLKEGDLNTKCFHAIASQRLKTNIINKLQNKDEIWITENQELKSLALKHFEDNFKASRSHNSICWNDYMGIINGPLSSEALSVLN